jgi:hypothetical protein
MVIKSLQALMNRPKLSCQSPRVNSAVMNSALMRANLLALADIAGIPPDQARLGWVRIYDAQIRKLACKRIVLYGRHIDAGGHQNTYRTSGNSYSNLL